MCLFCGESGCDCAGSKARAEEKRQERFRDQSESHQSDRYKSSGDSHQDYLDWQRRGGYRPD